MYGGGGEAPAPQGAPAQEQPEEKKENDQKTFLLNKDIAPDFKVGEELVVKIVAEHDKEFEVTYAPEPGKEEEGEGGEGGAPAQAPAPGGGDSMYG